MKEDPMPLPASLVAAVEGLDVQPRRRRWRSVTYCVVDAVWSIGIGYDAHVVPAVRRVATAAGDASPVVATDDVPSADPLTLTAFRATYLSPESLVALTTSHRTSSRSGILKAEAALRYADVLTGFGIDTLGDASNALTDTNRVDEISTMLHRIPGDGVRTGYFWMLVGDDDTVKPDRMILRFLDRHGATTDVAGAKDTLRELATHLSTPERPVTPWMVDHTIWRAERARR
jgi:hypothetical protein